MSEQKRVPSKNNGNFYSSPLVVENVNAAVPEVYETLETQQSEVAPSPINPDSMWKASGQIINSSTSSTRISLIQQPAKQVGSMLKQYYQVSSQVQQMNTNNNPSKSSQNISQNVQKLPRMEQSSTSSSHPQINQSVGVNSELLITQIIDRLPETDLIPAELSRTKHQQQLEKSRENRSVANQMNIYESQQQKEQFKQKQMHSLAFLQQVEAKQLTLSQSAISSTSWQQNFNLQQQQQQIDLVNAATTGSKRKSTGRIFKSKESGYKLSEREQPMYEQYANNRTVEIITNPNESISEIIVHQQDDFNRPNNNININRFEELKQQQPQDIFEIEIQSNEYFNAQPIAVVHHRREEQNNQLLMNSRTNTPLISRLGSPAPSNFVSPAASRLASPNLSCERFSIGSPELRSNRRGDTLSNAGAAVAASALISVPQFDQMYKNAQHQMQPLPKERMHSRQSSRNSIFNSNTTPPIIANFLNKPIILNELFKSIMNSRDDSALKEVCHIGASRYQEKIVSGLGVLDSILQTHNQLEQSVAKHTGDFAEFRRTIFSSESQLLLEENKRVHVVLSSLEKTNKAIEILIELKNATVLTLENISKQALSCESNAHIPSTASSSGSIQNYLSNNQNTHQRTVSQPNVVSVGIPNQSNPIQFHSKVTSFVAQLRQLNEDLFNLFSDEKLNVFANTRTANQVQGLLQSDQQQNASLSKQTKHYQLNSNVQQQQQQQQQDRIIHQNVISKIGVHGQRIQNEGCVHLGACIELLIRCDQNANDIWGYLQECLKWYRSKLAVWTDALSKKNVFPARVIYSLLRKHSKTDIPALEMQRESLKRLSLQQHMPLLLEKLSDIRLPFIENYSKQNQKAIQQAKEFLGQTVNDIQNIVESLKQSVKVCVTDVYSNVKVEAQFQFTPFESEVSLLIQSAEIELRRLQRELIVLLTLDRIPEMHAMVLKVKFEFIEVIQDLESKKDLRRSLLSERIQNGNTTVQRLIELKDQALVGGISIFARKIEEKQSECTHPAAEVVVIALREQSDTIDRTIDEVYEIIDRLYALNAVDDDAVVAEVNAGIISEAVLYISVVKEFLESDQTEFPAKKKLSTVIRQTVVFASFDGEAYSEQKERVACFLKVFENSLDKLAGSVVDYREDLSMRSEYERIEKNGRIVLREFNDAIRRMLCLQLISIEVVTNLIESTHVILGLVVEGSTTTVTANNAVSSRQWVLLTTQNVEQLLLNQNSLRLTSVIKEITEWTDEIRIEQQQHQLLQGENNNNNNKNKFGDLVSQAGIVVQVLREVHKNNVYLSRMLFETECRRKEEVTDLYRKNAVEKEFEGFLERMKDILQEQSAQQSNNSNILFDLVSEYVIRNQNQFHETCETNPSYSEGPSTATAPVAAEINRCFSHILYLSQKFTPCLAQVLELLESEVEKGVWKRNEGLGESTDVSEFLRSKNVSDFSELKANIHSREHLIKQLAVRLRSKVASSIVSRNKSTNINVEITQSVLDSLIKRKKQDESDLNMAESITSSILMIARDFMPKILASFSFECSISDVIASIQKLTKRVERFIDSLEDPNSLKEMIMFPGEESVGQRRAQKQKKSRWQLLNAIVIRQIGRIQSELEELEKLFVELQTPSDLLEARLDGNQIRLFDSFLRKQLLESYAKVQEIVHAFNESVQVKRSCSSMILGFSRTAADGANAVSASDASPCEAEIRLGDFIVEIVRGYLEKVSRREREDLIAEVRSSVKEPSDLNRLIEFVQGSIVKYGGDPATIINCLEYAVKELSGMHEVVERISPKLGAGETGQLKIFEASRLLFWRKCFDQAKKFLKAYNDTINQKNSLTYSKILEIYDQKVAEIQKNKMNIDIPKEFNEIYLKIRDCVLSKQLLFEQQQQQQIQN